MILRVHEKNWFLWQEINYSHKRSILLTRNQFLQREINFYNKKLILVTRNQFLLQEINSCHKKSILVTRNQFLSQEINSCHKKSFLVSSHPSVKLFYHFPTTRGSYKKIRLSLYISWEPGSQVPREFAALFKMVLCQNMNICLVFCTEPSINLAYSDCTITHVWNNARIIGSLHITIQYLV